MALEIRGVTVLLQVYDMPASIRFYRDVLGCRVVNTSPVLGPDYYHWALLELGEASLMLNTAYESNEERPPVRDHFRVTAHDDTGLFFACADVEGAYRELRDKGVDVREPITTNYGMRQVYVRDPDGYSLCFQWRA